jgi:hypothetical protein
VWTAGRPSLLVGVGAGLVTIFLLLPASGIDTDPPICSAALGYEVPCGSGLALGAALAASLVAALMVAGLASRRRDLA